MDSLITSQRESRLRAYSASPHDITEHFGIEQVVLAGGYGYRQVHELVQNGADAILEATDAGAPHDSPPRTEVLLADSCLYAANTGAPFSKEGIEAILSSHTSPKRGNQIGRFGLGFKSLLRLGGRIHITTDRAAFSFDPERCRNELRREFGIVDVPGLRLAWDLDDALAGRLRGRFPWATTVVCAEISSDDVLSHLRAEIAEFPAEFLLFLPVSLSVTLSSVPECKRELRRRDEGQDVILLDGDASSRWRVAEKRARIADERARDDATPLHTRDEVPLAWAVPLEGKREEAGRFWAFFPTYTPTYVPGIVNAPWKLNSDRNAVVPGEWNAALMREVAGLIAGTLPQLTTDADPGRPLDGFPRQIERADECAAPLIGALWANLLDAEVIPDANGRLRQGKELWVHPRDNAELARWWQAIASEVERGQVVHPSCLERPRSSRLRALAERFKLAAPTEQPGRNLRKSEAVQWFAAVAAGDTAQAIKVLTLAEAYEKDCKADEWNPVRPTLVIVPSDDGSVWAPAQVVFAPRGTPIPDGRHPVASAVCDDPGARRILTDVLKVKPLDDSVWREVLTKALPGDSWRQSLADEQWRRFWALLRSAPDNVRLQFAASNQRVLRVRRRDGQWVLADEALLPGAVVAADDPPPSRRVLTDAVEHGTDDCLLKKIGVSESPEGVVRLDAPMRDPRERELLGQWLWASIELYRGGLPKNHKPQTDYLGPKDTSMPRGWILLPKLSGRPKARLTMKFLEVLRNRSIPDTVDYGHTTQQHYPTIRVRHPLLWFLLEHGAWSISGEVVRLAAIVARLNEPAMAKLPDWQRFEPALAMLKEAFPPVSPSDSDTSALWRALVSALVTPATLGDDSLRELWAGAARDGFVPPSAGSGNSERSVPGILTGS